MKKRLCSSSGGFSIMSVLLILIPLINSSTTAAGGAPNPMMNITEPLSMSSMSMSIEESAGGDEELLMMDSEINRMLASSNPKSPYSVVNKAKLDKKPPCIQGSGKAYICNPQPNSPTKPCGQYNRDCHKQRRHN